MKTNKKVLLIALATLTCATSVFCMEKNPEEQLYEAATAGNVEKVKVLLENKLTTEKPILEKIKDFYNNNCRDFGIKGWLLPLKEIDSKIDSKIASYKEEIDEERIKKEFDLIGKSMKPEYKDFEDARRSRALRQIESIDQEAKKYKQNTDEILRLIKAHIEENNEEVE